MDSPTAVLKGFSLPKYTPSPVIRKKGGLETPVFLSCFMILCFFVGFTMVCEYLDFLSPLFLLPGEEVYVNKKNAYMSNKNEF